MNTPAAPPSSNGLNLPADDSAGHLDQLAHGEAERYFVDPGRNTRPLTFQNHFVPGDSAVPSLCHCSTPILRTAVVAASVSTLLMTVG